MRSPDDIAAIAIELSEKKEEAAVVADGDFRRLLWEEAKFLREAAEALHSLMARVNQLEQFLLDIPVCEEVALPRLEKAEAERDALIAYVIGLLGGEIGMNDPLPELVRQQIEAQDA